MKKMDSSTKVINLDKKLGKSGRQSTTDENNKVLQKSNTRVIAITSGKGGVGKTNIVANLGYALSKLGKKVLILDADLGLANIDVLLGLTPKYNFSHVITGAKTIEEIAISGPGEIKILPASSGIQELTKLTKEQGIRFLKELDGLLDLFDILLIDTGAGISSNVMYFSTTAQEVVVVVSPEPTSITDAYALMKVLSLKYSQKQFKLIVNQAATGEEASEVYRQLNLVAERFLDIRIKYIGHILFDENVKKCVRKQKIVSEVFPESDASRCFNALAKSITSSENDIYFQPKTNFLWDFLLKDDMD
jgi:flagellar biosynthesis protein FlhG